MRKMRTVAILLALALVLYLLNERLKKENKVRTVSSLPFGLRGMFFPPFGTLISAKHDSETVRQHEHCHYEQYKRLGLLGFYNRYLSQWLFKGYNNMDLERECRTNESQFCQDNYTTCYPKG